MDLYKEILIKVLENQELQVTFPNLSVDVAQIVEMQCYEALRKIKSVLEDDSLEDKECFNKIEEIICVFESLGSGAGNRHDFG